MRSTRAIRTRKVRGTIYKANFQQGALVINNELRDFRVFLNFVVRLEILAGAKFLLFLNWLRFELNHGWAEIVASGGAKEREVARLERRYCEAHRRREAADRAEQDAVGLRDADYRLVGSIEAMHFTYSAGRSILISLIATSPPSSKSLASASKKAVLTLLRTPLARQLPGDLTPFF
jgi:hypothetical protein